MYCLRFVNLSLHIVIYYYQIELEKIHNKYSFNSIQYLYNNDVRTKFIKFRDGQDRYIVVFIFFVLV